MFDTIITFSSIKYKKQTKIEVMLNASYETHVCLGLEMSCYSTVFF